MPRAVRHMALTKFASIPQTLDLKWSQEIELAGALVKSVIFLFQYSQRRCGSNALGLVEAEVEGMAGHLLSDLGAAWRWLT